jgi:hypothetical protein
MDGERETRFESKVLPDGLLDGIRELMQNGFDREQILAMIKLSRSIASMESKMDLNTLLGRVQGIMGIIQSDLELERLHGVSHK